MVALRLLLLLTPAGSRHNRVDSERAWWTGKDSNLRSPQGAADLQSAGFSHSPTRPSLVFRSFSLLQVYEKIPETSEPGGTLNRVPNRFVQQQYQESAETQNGLVSKDTSPFNFNVRNCFAPFPAELAVELAEGIEPPTL